MIFAPLQSGGRKRREARRFLYARAAQVRREAL